MDPARDREAAHRGRRLAGRGRGRGDGGRRLRGRSRAVVSNEIRATIIDHIINHGLSRGWAESAAKSATLNISGKTTDNMCILQGILTELHITEVN